MALISASLLAADFARLDEGLEAIERSGAKLLHIDVSDGHFSPGITVGVPVVARVRKATRLKLDVHLKIERPERFIAEFIKAGSDRLALHPESTSDIHRALREIRSHGAEAGVALSPALPVEAVSEIAEDLDFLSIVGTGEKPINFRRASRKLEQAVRLRRERGVRFVIQVEGDLTGQQAAALVASGAGVIVAVPGRAGFAGLKKVYEELVGAASGAEGNFAVAQGVTTGSESL